MITITRQQLIDKKACSSALRELDKLDIIDIKIANWNKAAQGFALGSKIGRKYFLWLFNNGLIPIFSLQKTDLQGVNLRKSDLRKVNLWGTNLQEANLSGADLSGADLGRANLSGADLSGANLWEANLWGAELSGANLNGANLKGAELWGITGRGIQHNELTIWPENLNKTTN